MAGVLELAQLAQHDRVAEMDVGCRRVDAQLHPQRPPQAQPLLEAARRDDVDGPGGELLGGAHVRGKGRDR